MDTNRTEGLAGEARGSIKEAIGKLTGDAAVEAEGRIEKTTGQARAAVGNDIDAVMIATQK